MDVKIAPPPPTLAVRFFADHQGDGVVEAVRVLAKWLHSQVCPSAKALLLSSCFSATPVASHDLSPNNTKSTTTTSSGGGVVHVGIETAAGTRLCTVECPSLDTTVEEIIARMVPPRKHTGDNNCNDNEEEEEEEEALSTTTASNRAFFLPGNVEPLNPQTTLREAGIEGPSCILIVMIFSNRWSREKSHQEAHLFSEDDVEITRPPRSSFMRPCAQTTNLLRKPGDCFQVRIQAIPPSREPFSVGILSAGFECPKLFNNGAGREPGTMGVYLAHVFTIVVGLEAVVMIASPQCMRRRDDRCDKLLGDPIRMFKPGDRLHFSIRQGTEEQQQQQQQQQLFLDVRLNGVLFCEEVIPSNFKLPFQPMCTLSEECCLVLER